MGCPSIVLYLPLQSQIKCNASLIPEYPLKTFSSTFFWRQKFERQIFTARDWQDFSNILPGNIRVCLAVNTIQGSLSCHGESSAYCPLEFFQWPWVWLNERLRFVTGWTMRIHKVHVFEPHGYKSDSQRGPQLLETIFLPTSNPYGVLGYSFYRKFSLWVAMGAWSAEHLTY